MLALAATLLALTGGPAAAHAASVTPSSSAGKTSAPATPAATPPAAAAPSEVTFGVQAASHNVADQRPRFLFGGGPGAAPFSDEIAVVNIGDTPLTLDLYPADAQTTTDGQFAFVLQHDKQTGIGAWLTLQGPAKVTVPPRTAAGPSRVFVPFSLKIPASASPGDHIGAIFASLHTDASDTGRASEALDQRVGIRVYARVSGAVHPALAIEQLKASYSPGFQVNPLGSGTVSVSYVVHNTGNVVLGANQRASVSGPVGGSTKAPALPQIPGLLPGTSIVVHTTIKAIFPAVRLTVEADLLPLAPVGDVDPGIKPVSASVSVVVVPWTLAIVIVLVVPGVGGLIGLRLHRLRRLRRLHPGRHGTSANRGTTPASAE